VGEGGDLVGELADVLRAPHGVEPVARPQLGHHRQHIHRLAPRVDREEGLPQRRVPRVVEVCGLHDPRQPRDHALRALGVEQRGREHRPLGPLVGKHERTLIGHIGRDASSACASAANFKVFPRMCGAGGGESDTIHGLA